MSDSPSEATRSPNVERTPHTRALSAAQLLALRRALTGEPVQGSMRPSLRLRQLCGPDGLLTDVGRATARSDAAQTVHPCCRCTGPVETRYLIPSGDEICPSCIIAIGLEADREPNGRFRSWKHPD